LEEPKVDAPGLRRLISAKGGHSGPHLVRFEADVRIALGHSVSAHLSEQVRGKRAECLGARAYTIAFRQLVNANRDHREAELPSVVAVPTSVQSEIRSGWMARTARG
jgi:hypothetical protein